MAHQDGQVPAGLQVHQDGLVHLVIVVLLAHQVSLEHQDTQA